MTSALAVIGDSLPRLITAAGLPAAKRSLDFFTARIPNDNTRYAYAREVASFCNWCEDRGPTIEQLEPHLVALYIKELGRDVAKPTVKQHLAATTIACSSIMDWPTCLR